MDDQVPWTGGISNRQIAVDSALGLVKWLALTVLSGAFLWWVSDFLPVPGEFRAYGAELGGVLASTALVFLRQRRNA